MREPDETDDLPEPGTYPERLADPAHQLDAYPIKDAAQRERLLQILEGEGNEGEGNEGQGGDADSAAGGA